MTAPEICTLIDKRLNLGCNIGKFVRRGINRACGEESRKSQNQNAE